VVVNKTVSLIGENKQDTIIDGNGTEIVVRVTAHNVNITGFTIQNGELGILFWYSHNNNLTSSVVANNQYGIYTWGSAENTFTGNTVINNSRYGIYVSDSDDNVLSGNTVSRNAYGIYFYYCRDSILASNGVSNNSNGLYFLGSNNNILVGNRISDSLYDGIWVFSSSNNIFVRNIVSHNRIGIGVQMFSNNNMIFHNNFVNNIESPRSVDSINSWDNGVEGNYWSDYGGTDENHDGIGDTPYLIEENSQDEYPLMAIFLQFNIPTENMDYKINTVCNSTISNFQLHSDSGDKPNAVSFKVNGAGFCRISIPHALVEPPFMVRVDGNPSLYFKEVYANATHTWLYFNYSHSEHEVIIAHASSSEQLLWPQLAIFGLAIIIVILFSIGVNYYRLFSKQKKVIEAYEREVGSFPVSHEERARMRFIKDVIEREKKIEEFKKKYGIKIQPASTLGDLMEKLGVQKES
jgi:parallel beta-helix repeat protein